MSEQDKMIKTTTELFDYMALLNNFKNSKFAKNIENQNVHTLLLIVYKFMQIIEEWDMYLGVLLTKVTSYKEKSKIGIMLLARNGIDYDKSNKNDPHNIPHTILFEEYIKLFDNKKPSFASSAYYKKNSLLLPIEKFCSDITNAITSNKWEYSCGVLASIQFVSMFASDYISNLTDKLLSIKRETEDEIKNQNQHYFIVNDHTCSNDIKCLLEMVIGKDKNVVIDGMTKGYEIAVKFYDSLAEIFDENKNQ
jgi:hypothetical protein